jgi:AraC-like DNA-binding protein
MTFFLCVTGRKTSQIFVPVLYFLSLACSFILPLLDIFPPHIWLQQAVMMGQGLTPAFSFLFIIQFLSGRAPPWIYWTILAVPLIGGSTISYATMLTNGEVCIQEHICTDITMFKQLYNIFSGALIFLLIIVIYERMARKVEGTPHQRKNKYALVLSLVVLNIALIAITLAEMTGHIASDRASFAATVVRIGFIYLVLTSIFRVFDHSVEIDYARVPSMRPNEPTDRDLVLVERIKALLTEEKIYRIMDLNREKFASRLAVGEHYLSRVINQCLDQSFSELISAYRIEEAKQRLSKEETAITVIGFEVGFASIPSFNRVFKQIVGMPPSEYRLSQQQAPKK